MIISHKACKLKYIYINKTPEKKITCFGDAKRERLIKGEGKTKKEKKRVCVFHCKGSAFMC